MDGNETTIVHHITITRTEVHGGEAINAAVCRHCRMVLERKEGPLMIGIPGLYAVQDDGEYFENSECRGTAGTRNEDV